MINSLGGGKRVCSPKRWSPLFSLGGKHTVRKTIESSTMGSPVCGAWSRRLPALCARIQLAARPGPELRPGASTAISARRNLNVQTAAEAGKLKSIDDLPGPSLSTTLYWLFVKGYADKSHLLQVWSPKKALYSTAED